MSDRRSQGRPCRGESEVGKEKILAALRTMLRSSQCYDLSRKTVAAHAGVTPALISYYFAKKEQLLLEAVTPIVAAYADEICRVADTEQTIDGKISQVAAILIRLYKIDGKMIDIYRDVADRTGQRDDQIARISEALSLILDTGAETCPAKSLDALILQGAIWGMCRFAAQAEQSTPSEDEEPRQERLPNRLVATLMGIVGRAPSLAGGYGLSPLQATVG